MTHLERLAIYYQRSAALHHEKMRSLRDYGAHCDYMRFYEDQARCNYSQARYALNIHGDRRVKTD